MWRGSVMTTDMFATGYSLWRENASSDCASVHLAIRKIIATILNIVIVVRKFPVGESMVNFISIVD